MVGQAAIHGYISGTTTGSNFNARSVGDSPYIEIQTTNGRREGEGPSLVAFIKFQSSQPGAVGDDADIKLMGGEALLVPLRSKE